MGGNTWLIFLSTNNEEVLVKKIEKAKNDTEKKLERRAIEAQYYSKENQIVIQFADGSEFSFPPQLGQGLENATPLQLAEVEITPSGEGLHWESLDADLSITDLLRGIYGSQKWMQSLKEKKLI